MDKPSYQELEEKIRKLESESVKLKRAETELLEKQLILRNQNINLVKKSIELSDIKKELEDKNYELELIRSQLRKENVSLIRKSIELSDIMRELEDKNYYLELSRSELEAALTALQESEYKYCQLVEESPDPIVSLDNTGNILSFNPMAERMSGYSKEEVLGKHFSKINILAEESVPIVLKEFALILSGIERPPYELTIIRRDKSPLSLEANSRLIGQKGKDAWIQVVFRDITERKEWSKALQKAHDMLEMRVRERTTELVRANESLQAEIAERKRVEEELVRLYTAIEQSAEGILITDGEGNILYINPAFETISGYSREEILGQNPRILKSGRHDKAFYRSMWDILSRGEVWTGHFINKKKNGRLFEIKATISPVTDSSGTITNYVGVGHDVTNEVKLEEQLRQAQKMEAIGTLAGGIAHDFNNILGPIFGYTELALTEIPEGDKKRFQLERVIQAAHRAKDLVTQIMTFSRQTKEERKPVKLVPIIKEVLKLLRASLPATIEIGSEVQTRWDTVFADSTQIHQVLMNLCTNSAHAMREKGGVLEMSLRDVKIDHNEIVKYPDLAPGSYLQLTVSDTGHGIPPAIQPRIFDPYFTTKRLGEGTGMGLAVVHGIVKSYGGAITLHSEVGKGSIFHVLLPKSEGEEMVTDEELFLPLPTGNEHILFVDDEEVLVEMSLQMLEKLGYQVVAQGSSIEALETFRQQPDQFDLVITDLTMPNMTGPDLARELFRIRPDIPIILCTGFSETLTERQANDMGFRKLLRKPLTLREIAQVIRDVLEEKKVRNKGT